MEITPNMNNNEIIEVLVDLFKKGMVPQHYQNVMDIALKSPFLEKTIMPHMHELYAKYKTQHKDNYLNFHIFEKFSKNLDDKELTVLSAVIVDESMHRMIKELTKQISKISEIEMEVLPIKNSLFSNKDKTKSTIH